MIDSVSSFLIFILHEDRMATCTERVMAACRPRAARTMDSILPLRNTCSYMYGNVYVCTLSLTTTPTTCPASYLLIILLLLLLVLHLLEVLECLLWVDSRQAAQDRVEELGILYQLVHSFIVIFLILLHYLTETLPGKKVGE